MEPSFVKPEFKKIYSGFLKRFKQAEIAKTIEHLKKFDALGGKLQAKDLLEKDRKVLVKELEDLMVKLKKQLTLELEFRKKQLEANVEMPPKGFVEVTARLNFKNVKRELKSLTEKAAKFAENGGGPPPEPKAPEFHFKPDYERFVPAILRDTSVVVALDKLDENADIKKVLQLFNAAQAAVKKQIADVTEDIKDCTAAKKGVLTKLVGELRDFLKDLEVMEDRVFMLNVK
jgi:hypothetical protein